MRRLPDPLPGEPLERGSFFSKGTVDCPRAGSAAAAAALALLLAKRAGVEHPVRELVAMQQRRESMGVEPGESREALFAAPAFVERRGRVAEKLAQVGRGARRSAAPRGPRRRPTRPWQGPGSRGTSIAARGPGGARRDTGRTRTRWPLRERAPRRQAARSASR